MQYLCPKHQQHILQDPKLAKTLWDGAMESGVIAYQQERWQTARNFFGSAYETTLLYMWNKPAVDETTFSIEHLVDAGQLLSHSLKKLKAWDEAQICLLTLQNSLLPLNHSHSSSSFLNKEEILNLTNNFVTTLIESFNLQTHLTHSHYLISTTTNKNTSSQISSDRNHLINDSPKNEVH